MSPIQVGILHPKNGYQWRRQIPPGSFSGFEFSLNHPRDDDDWLFVYEGLSDPVSTSVPKSRRVFVCGEPPGVKSYPARFLAQFGTIWSTDPALDHPGATIHHPCTPWHVGAYSHPDKGAGWHMHVTELSECTPRKTKLISVISSNKMATQGHRERLSFVQALKREFGDLLDVYGRGINDFDDKWSVIAHYKYHIALENSSYFDYWTEKLADPILTLTYPIYFGCPNINQYFDENALERIDIADVGSAIGTIRKTLDADIYRARVGELEAARRKLIADHNFFAEIAHHVAAYAPRHASPLASPERIRPEQHYDRLKRAARRLHRATSSREAR